MVFFFLFLPEKERSKENSPRKPTSIFFFHTTLTLSCRKIAVRTLNARGHARLCVDRSYVLEFLFLFFRKKKTILALQPCRKLSFSKKKKPKINSRITKAFDNFTAENFVESMKRMKLILIFFISTTLMKAQVEESKLFIEALSKGDDATAYQFFDTVISNKLPQNQLKVIWSGIQSQAGKFKGYLPSRTEGDIVYTPCEFEHVTFDLKLVFNDQKKITGFYFVSAKTSATYQKPAYDVATDYTTRDVVITTNNYSLPGILTIPIGKTNVPLVVLVHGSGPSDKDESIGPTKIFRDLAVGLAARGIATLRYDKRTKVYPAGLAPEKINIQEEITDDVASAINMVESFKEINHMEVYVLGHSLGGMVTPKIARDNPSVKGIILLAANARPLQDLLVEQMNYIFSADGLSDAEKQQLANLQKQVDASKDQFLSMNTPSSQLPLNIPANYWISLNNYHPLETAIVLKQKMLLLQGERDYQVTMTDYNLWKDKLRGHKNAVFKSYPKLNHLFIEGEGKSLPKEYEKAGNVAYYVIDDIANWINKL